MAANEDAAGEFDSDGWCLLHYAVWYKAPAPVVKAVFAANPEATEEKDKDGDTPLELGVKYSAAAGGVAVLRQYSTAAEVCRSYLLEGRSLDTAAFATWLDSNPSAAKDRNEDDENTALHYSMKIKGVPVGAVAALVAAWKGAAKRLDGGGRTPLHLALRHRAPVDVVKVVLSAWPKAMTVLDDDGNNPLHLGLLNKAPAVSACTGRRKAMADTVVSSRARVGACVYVRACMCVRGCACMCVHLPASTYVNMCYGGTARIMLAFRRTVSLTFRRTVLLHWSALPTKPPFTFRALITGLGTAAVGSMAAKLQGARSSRKVATTDRSLARRSTGSHRSTPEHVHHVRNLRILVNAVQRYSQKQPCSAEAVRGLAGGKSAGDTQTRRRP